MIKNGLMCFSKGCKLLFPDPIFSIPALNEVNHPSSALVGSVFKAC